MLSLFFRRRKSGAFFSFVQEKQRVMHKPELALNRPFDDVLGMNRFDEVCLQTAWPRKLGFHLRNKVMYPNREDEKSEYTPHTRLVMDCPMYALFIRAIEKFAHVAFQRCEFVIARAVKLPPAITENRGQIPSFEMIRDTLEYNLAQYAEYCVRDLITLISSIEKQFWDDIDIAGVKKILEKYISRDVTLPQTVLWFYKRTKQTAEVNSYSLFTKIISFYNVEDHPVMKMAVSILIAFAGMIGICYAIDQSPWVITHPSLPHHTRVTITHALNELMCELLMGLWKISSAPSLTL